MTKQTAFGIAVALLLLMQSTQANPIERQATITGGRPESGRCTIEVSVDGAAEVEVSGDHAVLTTLSGKTANWGRFQCTEPLPVNPNGFRLVATNGRGAIRLRQDPRNTGGRAIIHVSDSQGGSGGYTFDLWWQRAGNGAWTPNPRPQPPNHWPGRQPLWGEWPGYGTFPIPRAVQICQDSVSSRLNRQGYPYVTFERTVPGDDPSRRDWISGTVSGRRNFDTTRFSFSCSVDFASGQVRWFDVRPYQQSF